MVIIDSFRTDKTVGITKELGADVFEHRFENHAAQFNCAFDNIGLYTEWVIKFDADEEFTKELSVEIKDKLDCLDSKVTGVILRHASILWGNG